MRLTNVEKYAIQGMVGDGKTASWIAKAIDKPEAIIIDYVFKLAKSIVKVEEVKAANPPVEQAVEQPVEQPVEPVIDHEANLDTTKFTQEDVKEVAIMNRRKSSDYMIDKTRDKKDKGVKIMTAAASALAEERAKNYDTPTYRNQSAIFKPKGN